jgi:hypothetical protein
MARPKTSRSIAAEIERTFKTNMRLLDESMAGLSKNCKAYLDRVLAKAKLQQQYREERAARGLDPQNLGIATVIRYDFHAVVDAAQGEPDAKRQAFEDELDAEFPPQGLPVSLVKKAKTKKRTR